MVVKHNFDSFSSIYKRVIKMCHVQVEKGENFLQFHIKLTFVNVSIDKIQGHF